MRISRLIIIPELFIFICVIVAPVFVFSSTVIAATGSVQVGQPSNTGVAPSTGPGSTGGGGSSNDNSPPQISNVVVSVSYDSATVNWTTNELALSRISWGDTSEYRSGTIAGEQYVKKHSVLISGLQSRVQYFFSLTSIDTSNNQGGYAGEFVTLVRPDIQPPSNIAQFSAAQRVNRINLSWNNPVDPDFDLVRIVKSDKFFPLDPFNGQAVYEGRANSFIDTDVKPGVIYYYTGFSRDRTGNYSSGSIVYTTLAVTGEDGANIDPGAPVIDLQLPSVAFPPTNPNSFKDFTLTYKDGLTLDHSNLTIPVGEDLKIIIPKDKLPDAGSFLTLTVRDLAKKTGESSYLFAYDKVTKEYFVTTPTFNTEQVYGLVVTVFTSSKLIIEKVNGTVQIVSSAQASEKGDGSAGGSGPQHLPRYIVVVIVLGAGLAVCVHFWRMIRIRSRLDAAEVVKSDPKDMSRTRKR